MSSSIWCETVALDVLAAPSTLALLRRYEVAPIVAVFPHNVREALDVVARLDGEGLSPSIWPMLSDADGRWCNAQNAAAFVAFARSIVADAPRARALVVDLEPSIQVTRASITDGALSVHRVAPSADPVSMREALAALASLAMDLDARGIAMEAAIVPMLLLDGSGWEAMLGTPFEGVAWGRVSAMLYTSIIEGWSRGILTRADAVALLGEGTARARVRFGDRTAVSLGAVSTGALGDEPIYRSPRELAEDVAVARAAGASRIDLYDLGGVLARPPAEAWLSALTETEPSRSRPTLGIRARAVLGGAGVAGGIMGAVLRLRA